MTVIEYSSVCLRSPDWREKLAEARQYVESQGFPFGVQIHNNSSPDTVRNLVEWCPDGVQLSVHSPALAKHFLNLATSNRAAIEQTLEETLPVLDRARTDTFFFHGFFLTEQPITHDMSRYREVVGAAMGNGIALGDSFIMNPRIYSSELYRQHKALLTENFAWLQKHLPHLTVALENDYPGLGTALQRPEDIIGTIPNLWLDLGHLWVSSLVHGFNYYRAIDELVANTNIVGVHVNHNFSTPSMPVEELRDSHGHLYLPSPQQLKDVMQKLRRINVPIITLEVVDGDLNDLKVLIDWIR
jgi:sugar phosphate isomerase/epimerase